MDDVALTEEKKLTIEVVQFARSHRKELKPAEQWLNSIDEDIIDAWFLAERGSRDWRKILFLDWLFMDEKLYENEFELGDFSAHDWCENQDMQFFANFARMRSYGSWSTPRHPLFYVVRDALEEGKQAMKQRPDDLITFEVAMVEFCVSRSTLNRYVKDGCLKSYRLPNAAPNSKHLISRKELARLRERY